jgi:hypothetical protein
MYNKPTTLVGGMKTIAKSAEVFVEDELNGGKNGKKSF